MTETNAYADDQRLVLPALRGHMGDWVYYVTTMRLGDIAARVHMAGEIHESSSLDELLQREVTDRAGDIRNYLLGREDRFFSALVVGVYGGEPIWYDVAVRRNPFLDPAQIPERVQDALGILVLNGSERLFAIDGQHRAMGVREAVSARPELAAEQVTAIFVAHRTDVAGRVRTRRLFTTLNRYAKPVSPLYHVALDEDDGSAIVTRRLMDTYPLFQGPKVLPAAAKAMPRTAVAAFTSVVALYGAVDRYLAALHGSTKPGWKQLQRKRRSDAELEGYYADTVALWDLTRRWVPPVEEMAAAAPGAPVAAQYRHAGGGHVLFRPLGIDAFVEALTRLLTQSVALPEAVQRLAAVPMQLNEEPWRGVLWSSGNRILTSPEARRTAVALFLYGAGGQLKPKEEEERRHDLVAFKGAGAQFRRYAATGDG